MPLARYTASWVWVALGQRVPTHEEQLRPRDASRPWRSERLPLVPGLEASDRQARGHSKSGACLLTEATEPKEMRPSVIYRRTDRLLNNYTWSFEQGRIGGVCKNGWLWFCAANGDIRAPLVFLLRSALPCVPLQSRPRCRSAHDQKHRPLYENERSFSSGEDAVKCRKRTFQLRAL